jgi:LacI family transcriptional regulator
VAVALRLRRPRARRSPFPRDHRFEPDVDELVDGGPPLVYVNRRPRNPAASFVVSDNERGGMLLGRHLLELGHRRIAFLAGPAFSSVSKARVRGFRAALDEWPEPTHALLEETDFSAPVVRRIVNAWAAAPEAPTAIVGINDMVVGVCPRTSRWRASTTSSSRVRR